MKRNKVDHRLVRIVLVLILSGLVASEAPALDRRQLNQALAKITVIENGNPTAGASGFAWKKKEWVVTSLHIMRKDARYQVERPDDDNIWRAIPIAHVKDHDLVLLELRSHKGEKLTAEKLPGWNPLKTVAPAPGFGKDVYALGYYGDTPKPRFIMLKVEGSSPLEEKIPTEHAAKIKRAKIPNVALPVLHFMTTSLLPGYSGAPLVNEDGHLVAIGDGGLEKGAIDISWGIHAAHLDRLQKAIGTGLPANLGAAAQHYSAGLGPGRQVQSVTFGPYEFVYKKTRTFGQMLETVDNRKDLEYQLPDAELFDISSFRYDVYQDLDNGFIIAVPAGHDLKLNADGDLAVQYKDYPIIYDAGTDPDGIRKMLGAEDAHQALVELLREGIGEGSDAFMFDDDGSACDRSRDGGLLATVGFEIGDPVAAYSFTKIAAKGQRYLGATTFLADYNEKVAAQLQQNGCFQQRVDCGQQIDPSAPCATACNWLHVFTSVYLTTFSNFKAAGEGCDRANEPELFEATDSSRTVHGVIDWASFERKAMSLAEQGLYLRDIEVLMEGGQWVLGGVHQTLPVQTFWRYGYDIQTFNSEVQKLAQQGYQLKDLEVSWDGNWKYAGVFQPDARATMFRSYQNWQQVLADFQALEQNGWNLIDLEVPWGGQRFFIVGLYQYNSGPSAYRWGNWNNLGAQTQQLAQQGFNLIDIETYWDGQTQWFAGVYSQTSRPSFAWVGDWESFEQQTRQYRAQGVDLDDLELFPWNGTRHALGVFRR